jgi:hypothetical protein
MRQQSICRILRFFALALVTATGAFAQAPTSIEAPTIPANSSVQIERIPAKSTSYGWQFSPTNRKLFVVTVGQPDRRQMCHIQSFTEDKLVCSRAFGGSRTYLRQQVAALILPGFDERLRLPIFLGANVGLGTAIWGTVILAATCPVCAAATGVAALICFGAAGTMVYGDDVPDHLLYLAPGQELSPKLGYVQR